jgi:hypothetical protein
MPDILILCSGGMPQDGISPAVLARLWGAQVVIPKPPPCWRFLWLVVDGVPPLPSPADRGRRDRRLALIRSGRAGRMSLDMASSIANTEREHAGARGRRLRRATLEPRLTRVRGVSKMTTTASRKAHPRLTEAFPGHAYG